jgi:uncharacterized RDD family membrane protein YckC
MRLFAAGVDNICAGLLCILLSSQIPGLLPITRGAILVGAYLGYFFFQEALAGRTLGKWLFGLWVVRLDGHPAGWSASFWRTILRILEVNPVLLGALPGGLVVAWSKRKQRLGDMLGRALVVRQSDVARDGARA